jgi:hypothetical protein
MIMPRLFPALLLCALAATACDEDTIDTRDEDLESSSGSSGEPVNDSNPEDLENMPPNDQQNDNGPKVGDIVIGEDVPDRTVYLLNAAELPLMFLLLRVGDLEFSELDTPEFVTWRANKCAEHPAVDPGAVLCEYRYDVGE